ncbi:MAG: hypothetical protein RL757_1375 [Bacteroidota bacterium]|jgi:hypothetical protein
MLEITWQYIPIQTDVAFLRIKQQYIENKVWLTAFFIHVFTSMFALLSGFTQFSPRILRKNRLLHRRIGYFYIFNIVFVTGPSGFIMGLFANGGLTSRVAFVLLSILWIGTTAMAWRRAMQRDFVAHRHWMMRSYALTLSAITLRVWKMGFAVFLAMPPLDTYKLVAWLGFVPNLLLAEWLIFREKPTPQYPSEK